MKNIVLCADDYGLNACVSQGIVDLLSRGNLSAVSCLSSASGWPEHAAWLKPFVGKANIGLHLNLTEGTPVSAVFKQRYGKQFFSLPRLILNAFLGHLDQNIIEVELSEQLNIFKSALGFLPHFIDGHQHIHQLPIVRDAVLAIYNQHLRGENTYVRSILNNGKAFDFATRFKKIIINNCGAKGLQSLLEKESIPYNTSFGGIYSFEQAYKYPHIFQGILLDIQSGGLIMCHPGLENPLKAGLDKSTKEPDVIAQARFFEYRYLASDQFRRDCERLGVRVGCFGV